MSHEGGTLRLANPEEHLNKEQKSGSKCSFRDAENCAVTFFIKSSGSDSIMMIIRNRNCHKINLLTVFLSIFGAILLIGLLILLFVAIFKRVWHARQLKKFEKIQRDQNPEQFGTFASNPMYKPAQTTHNPRQGSAHFDRIS